MPNLESSTPAQVHLDEIGQIAITVSDLPRSRDFYQSVLGMQLLFDAARTLARTVLGCFLRRVAAMPRLLTMRNLR